MGWAKNFRRAKSEWLSAIFSGPLGPGIPKIEAGAAPPPRLTLPSQRSRFVSCVRATARVARKPSPLGDRGGTSGPPGNGPMGASGPTKDQTHLRIRRRGGCPHPPVSSRVPFLGGPASVRPLQKGKCASGYAVGAGALTRPPCPATQLEPHRSKGALKKGSSRLSTIAGSAGAKDEGRCVD